MRIRAILVWALLILSIAFGFFRQIKVALRSVDAVKATHYEPGEEARDLKSILLNLDPQAGQTQKISYYTNRTNGKGKRPSGEFLYDAQYGFAPLLLTDPPVEGGYYLLDFESDESIREFIKKNHLHLIAQRGFMALAEKERDR